MLHKIAAQAALLSERLSHPFVPNLSPNEEIIKEWSHKWQQQVGKGHPEWLHRRIEWAGWTLDTLLPLLDDGTWQGEPPAWATFLEEMITCVGQPRSLPPLQIPFEDIFAPITEMVLGKLKQRGESRWLNESVWATLAHDLLQRYSLLYGRTLDIEFALFRGRQEPLSSPAAADEGNRLYLEFVRYMQTGGLLTLFEHYPVLARLLAVTSLYWIDTLVELLRRLAADQQEITQTFGAKADTIAAIQPHLSDSHHNQRTVLKLTFASGLVLIYKPKSLGMEKGYNDLLDWANQNGMALSLRVVKVLSRQTYGWMEWIDHRPCADAAAVHRFYRRAGTLLGVLHLLNGTDCHAENIIADGEQPLLIDAEMLLYPHLIEANTTMGSPVQNAFEYSVLTTGFLPLWKVSGGSSYDVSGLGGHGETNHTGPVWKHVNTDAMELHYEPITIPNLPNTPFLSDGSPIHLADYAEDMAQGFEEFYWLIMTHRDEFLAKVLPRFADQEARYIFRPTSIYGAILNMLTYPENLTGGIAYSMTLELLCRGLVTAPHKPAYWPILAFEQYFAAQMDIPFFSINTGAPHLYLPDGSLIENIFEQASYPAAVTRIRQMDDRDLAQQLRFIRGSLHAYQAVNAEGIADLPPEPSAQATPPDHWEAFTPDQLIEEARRLGNLFHEMAIHEAQGAGWVSFEHIGQNRYRYQPIGYGLYDGSSGIILFLAALERVTQAGYRDLIDQAVRAWQYQLDDPNARRTAARIMGIGAGRGIGSIVYALAQASRLLHEDRWLELAERTAALITPESIALDRSFDVIAGSAGAILGLLALGGTHSVEQAAACGDHLLAHQQNGAWKTVGSYFLTGFSHGAAGIAYALLRLYGATGEPRFRDAATQAIAYEQRSFSAEAGNWRDLQYPDMEIYKVNWCHGAPGIGLARLGGLAWLDTLDVRQQIDVALKATLDAAQQATQLGVDHLCCGTMGRVDVLLTAAQILDRPALADQARQIAARLIQRAQQSGGYVLFPNLPHHVLNLCLFQGIAGIGYQLLRLAHPQEIPSVLLWGTHV